MSADCTDTAKRQHHQCWMPLPSVMLYLTDVAVDEGNMVVVLCCAAQEDGPDALEEVTNSNMLPAGKKLRSDDPNHKSSEQIRWVGQRCTSIVETLF